MDKLCCGCGLRIGVRLIGMLWGVLFFYYSFLMIATLSNKYPLWEYLIFPMVYFGTNFLTFAAMLLLKESQRSRLAVAGVFTFFTVFMSFFQIAAVALSIWDVCVLQRECVGDNTRFMLIFAHRIEVGWIFWIFSSILYIGALIVFRSYISAVLIFYWRAYEEKET